MAPVLRRYDALAAAVLASPPRQGVTRLVAVDGFGGAGKSTFAGRLTRALGDAQVIHTDDFVDTWDDSTGYWERMHAQVLAPLLAGRPGRYQRYDWHLGALAEWHDVPAAPVVLVEGVASARVAIADALTLAVWISTPAELRLQRGLERDGAENLDNWQRWIAQEQRHFAADRTAERADLTVDGQPSVPHAPEAEFVCLGSRNGW
jgi:uridine kinase